MTYVLFVCTHNAGRSQIAQAFFERYAPDDVRAESAGEQPADAVWPNVVEAMAEVGIVIADRRPKRLDLEMQLHADWAITLGCGGACPYVPTMVEDWQIGSRLRDLLFLIHARALSPRRWRQPGYRRRRRTTSPAGDVNRACRQR